MILSSKVRNGVVLTCDHIIIMLINHIKKKILTTIIENIKQKKLISLLFFYKIFLKIVNKLMNLSHPLTFNILYVYYILITHGQIMKFHCLNIFWFKKKILRKKIS